MPSTYPTGDNNDEDNDELNDTQQVLQSQSPLQSKTVNQESSGDAGKTNSTLVPAIDFDLSCVQDVLAEHN